METPTTRYARSPDGTFIAYSVSGDGPVDLVVVGGYTTHLELTWQDAPMALTLQSWGRVGRVIMFDKRGCGLSDRTSPLTDLDTRAQDLLAVMDAAGSERAILVGEHEGGALTAFVAATYPERVRGLVWWGGQAKNALAPDNPDGVSEEEQRASLADIERRWGTMEFTRDFMRADHSEELVDDQAFMEEMARWFRFSASPAEAMRFDQMWWETDVRSALPLIQVPTLIVTPAYMQERAATTTAAIAGADLQVLEGTSNLAARAPGFRDAVIGFAERIRDEEAELDRVLATVLFTDIVDSTATAAVMGDAKWRALVDEHDRIAKGLISRFRGEYRKSTGDGLMATFDGPARAVRCAQAFVEAVKPLGIEVRTGAHTGEVTFGDNDLAGIGVHVAARVAGLAGTSEVWASSTVKDLTAGSGLTFADAGEHELKGVPDTWHLYRVVG